MSHARNFGLICLSESPNTEESGSRPRIDASRSKSSMASAGMATTAPAPSASVLDMRAVIRPVPSASAHNNAAASVRLSPAEAKSETSAMSRADRKRWPTPDAEVVTDAFGGRPQPHRAIRTSSGRRAA